MEVSSDTNTRQAATLGIKRLKLIFKPQVLEDTSALLDAILVLTCLIYRTGIQK